MYIHVKVRAGAKKEMIEKISSDHFAVSVREKAERNMANRRVAELLAGEFHVSVKQVRLLNGHHSPSKVFSVNR